METTDIYPLKFAIKNPTVSFTGRYEELHRIYELFQQRGKIIITGPSGTGKSELARKYAHNSDYEAVIWINAETQESTKQSLRKLAKQKFNLKDENSVYKCLAKRKSLFIFVNAESYASISRFLPDNAHVLITSNNCAEKGATTLSLDNFTEAEAVEYVTKTAGSFTNEEIINLTKRLNCYPLALQLACVYIKETRELNRKRGIKYTISDFLTAMDQGDVIDSILKLLYKKIKSKKESVLMLNMISYFASSDIPEEMFLHDLADGVLDRLISITNMLEKYSIVELDESLLRIHGRIQHARRLQLVEQGEEEETLDRALCVMKKVIVDRASADVYAPHVVSVWKHALKYDGLIKKHLSSYFYVIAGCSDYELIENLVDKIELNQIVNQEEATPLHNAALNGDKRVVQLLLQNGADVNAKKEHGWTPLLLATNNNHTSAVEALLEDTRVEVNAKTNQGNTALHFAVSNNNIPVVQLLINKKADVDAETEDKYTPLHLAAKNGNVEIINALQFAKIDATTKDNFTPLHFAAQKGNTAATHALLHRNANVNAETKGGFTALHFAAQKGYLEIVNALLSKNANVDVKTSKGNTPVYLATKKGHTQVVNALLEKGACVDVEDNNKFTPLHWAALCGYLEIVNEILKKNGVYIDAQTSKGNTPLHLAAQKGHINVIKSLIENNANNIRNSDGKTAKDVAHADAKDYIMYCY